MDSDDGASSVRIAAKSRPTAQRAAHVKATEIRVVGMSRSGNHAIIDWILGQAPGGSSFDGRAGGSKA